MAKERPAVKIKLSERNKELYEVLKRSNDGEYHRHGRSYTLKGLVSYLLGGGAEFIFDSPEIRRRYEEEVRRYEKSQRARKAEWEAKQKSRRELYEKDIKFGFWKLGADTLVHDMRCSHDEE